MFSERHTASLLKRGNCNGRSKLEIQESLEKMLKADKDYTKIGVQVPSDIRKETILWMMMQARILGLRRSSFYNAVDRYDLRFMGKSTNDLLLHKLVGRVALRVEKTTDLDFETSNRGQEFEEYFTIVWEGCLAEMEESILEKQTEVILDKTADFYLDYLVLLLGDSTESNEQNKTVLEMREVLDLCILETGYRMYSPLAVAAGVYFWYARGVQAPWLHFLSSICPDMAKVIDWIGPTVKTVNGRHLEAQEKFHIETLLFLGI